MESEDEFDTKNSAGRVVNFLFQRQVRQGREIMGIVAWRKSPEAWFLEQTEEEADVLVIRVQGA